MVNNEAIISIISKLSKINTPPCKKTLQKIVYLIESKNTNLGCDYGIHFYGPYSADLDFAVRELCEEGILDITYTSTEHKISVLDDSTINKYYDKTINEVIDEFGKDSPSDLELLATAIYVFSQVKNADKVKAGVIKIKGAKYTDRQIDTAILRLKNTGYIVT